MTMHNPPPPHPGEFIRETYIELFDISIRSLAENLGVAASTLARIVSERTAVSPEMALRLSKALGRTCESISDETADRLLLRVFSRHLA